MLLASLQNSIRLPSDGVKKKKADLYAGISKSMKRMLLLLLLLLSFFLSEQISVSSFSNQRRSLSQLTG